MNLKEVAAHYNAKVFDSPEAAESAGWVVTETMTPRNVWNKASAAQAIVAKLLVRKNSGEAVEIGLVIENHSVSGCYLPLQTENVKTGLAS
jgi:hypothetical protein